MPFSTKGSRLFVYILFALILIGVGANQYFLLKTSHYDSCDRQACTKVCTSEEVGGRLGRADNPTTHNTDGFLDCLCLGTIGSPFFKHIPVFDSDKECK